MRIAFIGKGGSGKTSLSTQFAKFVHTKGFKTVTIDADVNQHFSQLIGHSALEAPALADKFRELFRCLYGDHPFFAKDIPIPEFGSFPPTQGAAMWTLDHVDMQLPSLARKIVRDWWHFRVGDYSSVELGGDCYHFKLNTLELLLHHVQDTAQDIFVIDSTAGIDTVATSLVMAYDLTVFVVEPTGKSVAVANDYIERVSDANIVCVGNKIETQDDLNYLTSSLRGEVIASLPFSSTLHELEQIERQEGIVELPEFHEACATIIKHAQCRDRNVEAYWNKLREIFVGESTRYWNGHYGVAYDEIVNQHEQHPFFAG